MTEGVITTKGQSNSMTLFSQRLKALGFSSYKDYLNGPHWQDFKSRYRASKRPRVCEVCGFKKIQLHHHTYVRLGHERFEDVIPLCREHHEAVHAWLKEKKHGNVGATAKAIKHLKRHRSKRPIANPSPKKKKQKREITPEVAALAVTLYALHSRTCLVKRKVCNKLIRRNDVQGIKRLIEKLQKPAPPGAKRYTNTEPHSAYVARQKAAAEAMAKLKRERDGK